MVNHSRWFLRHFNQPPIDQEVPLSQMTYLNLIMSSKKVYIENYLLEIYLKKE